MPCRFIRLEFARFSFLFPLLLGGPCLAEEGYGDLTGQFIFDGDTPAPILQIRKGDEAVKDAAICAAEDHFNESLVVDPKTKGIANVFIYLPSKDALKLSWPESLKKSSVREIAVEQKLCQFHPRAAIVRTDQALIFRSLDPNLHEVRSYHPDNNAPGGIISIRRDDGIPAVFTNAERVPLPVKCETHAWMSANILIIDHPYAAVTDREGRFKIRQLPEGNHVFRIWQERDGFLIHSWKVTVKGDTKVEPVKLKFR